MQRDLVQFQTPPPPLLDQDQEGLIKATSRQNSSSRKKKRDAELRIGYARDANAHSPSFDADDVIIADGTDSLPEPSPSFVSVSVAVQSQPEVEPEAEPKAEAEPQSDEAEVTPDLRLDQSKALIAEKLSSDHQLAASVSSARKDAIASISQDASNNADLVLKAAEELSSTETDKWLSSTEALEAKKMELEIESHIIGDAGLVLNSSIETSVEDDKREKESLCKKKETLTDELEKLLASVSASISSASIVTTNQNPEKYKSPKLTN